MRPFGQLIVAIALVVGMLAAATAYLAPLSLPDSAFNVHVDNEVRPATITAAAGLTTQEDGSAVPLVKAGTPATPDTLESLRAAKVKYVRLKEFSLARWPGKWWFVGAAGGLFVGAMLVRTALKRQISGASTGLGGKPTEGPAVALAALREVLQRLRDDIPRHNTSEARLALIVNSLGEAQRTHMEAFLAARVTLVGTLGMSGFAMLMDRFAAGERQINRAWSAAVDGYEDEAMACITNADELLAQAQSKLQRTNV